MALRHGAGPAGALTPHEARKDALGTRPPSKPTPKEPQAAYYSVADGRVPAGRVIVADGFIAVDVNGNVIGRFSTLREAATALPVGRAS